MDAEALLHQLDMVRSQLQFASKYYLLVSGYSFPTIMLMLLL